MSFLSKTLPERVIFDEEKGIYFVLHGNVMYFYKPCYKLPNGAVQNSNLVLIHRFI